MLVGFEPFERMLEQMAKVPSDGYPPYNIEQIDGSHFRISLAVAGFLIEELRVEVDENRLSISGHQQEREGGSFLHRGIAKRQFQRSFLLASGLEISGSWLENGMLHIDIVRPDPDTRVRQIDIKSCPDTVSG